MENGKYVDLEINDQRAKSEVLGLELVNTGETLRLFNPATCQFLPNTKEAAQAQERLSELDAMLARYRQQFGELPK